MIKQILQEGFSLKNKGHYKHAIEIFYKALELDNSSSELMLEIAECYYELKNEEKALNYIEQVLDKDPKHILTLKLLKKIFIDQKAYNEAEQTAKNIYCISQNINDLVDIFKLLNLQGKFNEIFEFNIDTNNAQIYFEKATALFRTNNLESCKDYILKALKNFPEDQKLLLLLAQTFYALEEIDNCQNILDKIIQDDKNEELLNLEGLIAHKNGNIKLAKKKIKMALEISPRNDRFYYNLANIYFQDGDIKFAKIYYTHAINLNEKNRIYHLALANLFYSQKQYKRAIEELYEDYFESNLLKAIILYDTGYLALARNEINKLEKEQPQNSIVKNYKKKIEEELELI